jgi:Tol biopolymer transport system component
MKRIVTGLLFAAIAGPAAAQIYVDNPPWEFGQNKIAYDQFAWKTYKSTHFLIYYYDKEAGSLQKVASFAESAYDDISRELNFQIPKPINLIYYATHTDFEQTNTLLNFIPEGVGAFALPTRNRMVLPIDMPDEKLQELIAHELTHVFQFEILFNGNYIRAMTTNAPQWLTEGMASYFGKDEDSKDKMVLRDAVLSDRVPEISQRGIYGFFAYRFGHAVFDFIAAEWGKDAVRDFVFEYRNQIGPSVERTVKRTFNVTGEDFDIRFRRYLRQKYLKILTEKGEPIDFGERFKIEDTPSAELSPRAYPSGDFVAAISTYKEDADVVVLSTRDRRLFKNLTKGRKTAYEYLVAQWITTGPAQGVDLAVSGDGNRVAVFARRERGRDLLLLDALSGDILERIEMPDVDQQLNPAFSPDGNRIAFHGMRAGRADIYIYDTSDHSITNVTDDESFDFGPVFSPDGQWIYYSSVEGTHAKIFRLRTDNPATREQITYGEGNDEDASLSPDGKRLYYTSDRDAGIYNIYSQTLDSGETYLHTNVVGGCFGPTAFIGKDNAEKLVFTAYYKGRFQLYIADPKKPVKKLQELAPAITPATPVTVEPYQPAIEVSVDPEKVESKPSRKLYLEDAQVIAGVNTDQTFLSNTILTFGDNLGDRHFIAVISSQSSFTQFDLQYWNLRSRLQKGIQAFDYRLYYTGIDLTTGQFERVRQAARYTGGTFIANYPLSRYFRLEGNIGYVFREVNYPFLVQGPGGVSLCCGVIPNVSSNYPIATLKFIGDTVEYQEWGPRAGYRIMAAGSYAPDFKKDVSVPPGAPLGTTLSQDVLWDLREYLPISRRMLFALRTAGLSSKGNLPTVCSIGSIDTLRGIPYGSLFGNACFYANFEFRFPLIDLIALPFLAFRDIRAHAFFDIGGTKFKGGAFQLWNSETDQLKDAVASYGGGVDVTVLGLPVHIDMARLMKSDQAQLIAASGDPDFAKALSKFVVSWYIGFVF